MNLEVKVEMTAKTYFIGESIECQLTLENQRNVAITAADPSLNELTPEYIVTRPDGSSITVTRMNKRPTNDEAITVTRTMTLSPHAQWSERIPLNRMVLIKEPGTYSLQVALRFEEQRLLTPPVKFIMEKAQITAFATVPELLDTSDSQLSVAWVHSGVSRMAVLDEVRLEDWWAKPKLGVLYSHIVYQTGPAEVRQTAVPAMHAARGMDFKNWVVWIEQGKIRAQRTEVGKPVGAPELVFESDKELLLVDPPVMDVSHNLELVLIERHGADAALLRLDVTRATPTTIKEVYRLPRTKALVAARALHYQTQKINHTEVFWLEQSGSKGELMMLVDGTSPKPVVLERFDGNELVPGSPLAVYRAAEGFTIVGWASLKHAGGESIQVRTVKISDEGKTVGQGTADMSIGDWKPLTWAFLAISKEGPQLLWRTKTDRLYYVSAARPASRVVPIFQVAPPPSLLPAGNETFIVGVSSNDEFTIEQISPKTLEK